MPSFVKKPCSTNKKSTINSAIRMSCLVEITSHVFSTGRSIGRGQESADGKELVTNTTAMQCVQVSRARGHSPVVVMTAQRLLLPGDSPVTVRPLFTLWKWMPR